MKEILDRCQKRVLSEQSRTLLFLLVSFTLILVLAVLTRSMITGWITLILFILLGVQLFRCLSELTRIRSWINTQPYAPKMIFRQQDTVFLLKDRWLCWTDRKGSAGTYQDILTCVGEPILSSSGQHSEEYLVHCRCQQDQTLRMRFQSQEAAIQVMTFLATQNPAIRFSVPLPRIRQELEDLSEHRF